MRTLLALLAVAGAATAAPAAVQTKVVEYTHDGATHKGFLAYDDAKAEKRPGVLVLHEWWGLNEDAKNRAKMLAELGYVAFCGDMYGEGKVVDHPKDAGAMATAVRKDVQAWRAKARAALDTLKKQPNVDPERLAAIGYCFGGSTALQLAYSGAELDAVVTFHAALPAPTAEEAKNIKARILVCHGADDTFIPEAAITKFKAALDGAKVKYQFESYPGAVHSFTVKGIDEKMVKGLAYNAEADKKSWEQMQALFKEALGKN
jgi:dienelactone hydrolase